MNINLLNFLFLLIRSFIFHQETGSTNRGSAKKIDKEKEKEKDKSKSKIKTKNIFFFNLLIFFACY